MGVLQEPAVSGLVRTVLSDYRRLRSTIGLARYDEAAITTRRAASRRVVEANIVSFTVRRRAMMISG